MPDPRLCCAAGVCCDPPEARAATISLLQDLLGVSAKGEAERLADEMANQKIVLFDGAVTEALRQMVVDSK
jgi:hypothetical protein